MSNGDDNLGNDSAHPQQPPQKVYYYEQKKSHTGWKVFWGIFTVLSVLANLLFLVVIIVLSIAAFSGMAGQNVFLEKVLQKGDVKTKIVVINMTGVIDDRVSKSVSEQMLAVRRDASVRGIILRVNTPGGTVAASDQIHYDIVKYREQSGKPVVAFMQGLATSGGYYTSVAANKIVAEPTVITGSIGVIMTHLVVQQLLEEKLGVNPVVIKSGLRKDWPSMFNEPTQEELDYLNQKVIIPAYDRFVALVSDGREELDLDEVKELADGSIYSSSEALEKKLIDEIGYFDKAVQVAAGLAGVTMPHVVQYEKPFSFSSILASESKSMDISRKTMREFAGPEILYIWQGY